MKFLFLSVIQLCTISLVVAQSFTLEGTILDNQNNRKLNNVEIRITDDQGSPSIMITTDDFGLYKISLESGLEYSLELERVAFKNLVTSFDATDLDMD